MSSGKPNRPRIPSNAQAPSGLISELAEIRRLQNGTYGWFVFLSLAIGVFWGKFSSWIFDSESGLRPFIIFAVSILAAVIPYMELDSVLTARRRDLRGVLETRWASAHDLERANQSAWGYKPLLWIGILCSLDAWVILWPQLGWERWILLAMLGSGTLLLIIVCIYKWVILRFSYTSGYLIMHDGECLLVDRKGSCFMRFLLPQTRISLAPVPDLLGSTSHEDYFREYLLVFGDSAREPLRLQIRINNIQEFQAMTSHRTGVSA